MPFIHETVDREIALEHNGVTVYQAYKDGYFDTPLTYWFALSPDDEAEEFDVRDLAVEQTDDIDAMLKAAIDAGLLKNPEGEAA
jgi:hypothetical protein